MAASGWPLPSTTNALVMVMFPVGVIRSSRNSTSVRTPNRSGRRGLDRRGVQTSRSFADGLPVTAIPSRCKIVVTRAAAMARPGSDSTRLSAGKNRSREPVMLQDPAQLLPPSRACVDLDKGKRECEAPAEPREAFASRRGAASPNQATPFGGTEPRSLPERAQ